MSKKEYAAFTRTNPPRIHQVTQSEYSLRKARTALRDYVLNNDINAPGGRELARYIEQNYEIASV